MNISLTIAIIIFILGLYFYARQAHPEGFESNTSGTKCPNLLIEKDSHFYLYNSTAPKVPGLNPIQFDSLQDYTQFLEWQKSKGIRCPVLYLQHTYDAQGYSSYAIRPSVSDLQGGAPHNAPSYSENKESKNESTASSSSFSPSSSPSSFSPSSSPSLSLPKSESGYGSLANAMSPYWAGIKSSIDAVKAGVFQDDKVLVQEKTQNQDNPKNSN
jgi:hypothetical protein